MTLGQRIMNYRKQKNLSQEEVAEKLNVTRQTVSKWETDQSTPDFDKILPLCDVFEISSEELLRGEISKEEQGEVKEKLENNTMNKSVDDNKINRTKGLAISIFLYFVAVAFIMVSIPVFRMDPVLASALFILICGVATVIIIYTGTIYKKEKERPKEEIESKKMYKQIDKLASLITLIIYLGISFTTFAWHITWIIWLIYALVMEIVKLVISLKGEENEK